MPAPTLAEPLYDIFAHVSRSTKRHCLMSGLTKKEADFRLNRLVGLERFIEETRKEISGVLDVQTQYLYDREARNREADRLVARMQKLPYWIRQRIRLRYEYNRIFYRVSPICNRGQED